MMQMGNTASFGSREFSDEVTSLASFLSLRSVLISKILAQKIKKL
jgi:hypothetical protein